MPSATAAPRSSTCSSRTAPTSSGPFPGRRGGSTFAARPGDLRPRPATILSSTSRGTMPPPTPSGRASACRPRRSGSTPRAAALQAGASRGATSSPDDEMQHLPRRLPAPASRDGSRHGAGRRRRGRTAYGLYNPSATCGSGVRTGSRRRTTRTRPETIRGGRATEANAYARRLVPLPRLLLPPLPGRRAHLEHAGLVRRQRRLPLRHRLRNSGSRNPLDFLIRQCKRSRGRGGISAMATVEEVGARATAPIRLGVIGLGVVAQAVHLPLIAKHPELFRPTALCDLSASTCARLAERLGIEDVRQFGSGGRPARRRRPRRRRDPDVGVARRARRRPRRRGSPIFCEKPLAYTLAEADALRRARARLMLGYMKLYDPAVERARELLARGRRRASVEVTVLHPPDAPQLAHAGLLPGPTDVDRAPYSTSLAARRAAALERALGRVPARDRPAVQRRRSSAASSTTSP